MERTLIFFKPDAWERNIIHEIIEQYIQPKGFQIITVKPVIVQSHQIMKHYEDNLRDKSDDVLKRVLDFYVNKMVLVLVLEKENAIRDFRELLGHSDPIHSPKGTIRGDYCDDSYERAENERRSCRNIIHASDSQKSFLKELNIWIKNAE